MRTLSVLLVALISSVGASSQTLTVCKDQPSYEECEHPRANFYIPYGGSIYALVTGATDFASNTVYYEVFTLDEYGNETYNVTIQQTVEPEWTWYWKEILLYSSGSYVIYFYDELDHWLDVPSDFTAFDVTITD